jgi:hypothetical protein
LVTSSHLSAPAFLAIQSATGTQVLGFQGRPRKSALKKTKKAANPKRVHIREDKNRIKYTYSGDFINQCFPGWMEDLDELVDRNGAEVRYVNWLLGKWEEKMRYLPQELCKKLALQRGALYRVVANAEEAYALNQECEEAYEHAQYAARHIQCWYEVMKDVEDEEEEEIHFDNQADAAVEDAIDNEVIAEEPVIVQEPKKKGKKKLARELECTLDGEKWKVSGGKRSRKQRDIFRPC